MYFARYSVINQILPTRLNHPNLIIPFLLHSLKVGVKNAKSTPTCKAGKPQNAVYGQWPLKVGVKTAKNTHTCENMATAGKVRA